MTTSMESSCNKPIVDHEYQSSSHEVIGPKFSSQDYICLKQSWRNEVDSKHKLALVKYAPCCKTKNTSTMHNYASY